MGFSRGRREVSALTTNGNYANLGCVTSAADPMQSRALPHPHISARALCVRSHISEPSAKQKTEEKEIEEMAKRKVNFNTRIYRELLILLAHEMFSNCFTSFAR